MKIAFFRGAAEDLIEAAEYYEMRQRGLGGDVAAEVQRVVALLLETPTLGERLDRVHRRVQLKRFPYGLIFRLEGDVIRVVAIAHRRRRARYWSFRIQDCWQADKALLSFTG
jgi:plasmid stabilization system protein ParE